MLRSYFAGSACLTALLVSLSPNAAHAAPLIAGLGGPVDFGTNCVGPNDDGFAGPVDLTDVFGAGGIRFFSEEHLSMYVNTNGNVSFSEPVPTFTPGAFPIANQPMIAPYWADVDIRTRMGMSTMCLQPEGGTTAAPACHNPMSNGIWWHVDTDTPRIIVTWHEVGYFRCKTDKSMSFQLILTPVDTVTCAESAGSDFDVEFRFETCEWNTGDASGGREGLSQEAMCEPFLPGLPPTLCPIPVPILEPPPECDAMGICRRGVAGQAGFDAGNSMDFVEIMNSRTNEIHTTLCGDSNVGEAGVWRFQIRQGVVLCPDAGEACDTGEMGICAEGQTQCVADGVECVGLVEASDEICDALDNDCNGMVDDGDLCGEREMCVRGTCIGVCFEGGCPTGQVCTAEGRCVDEGCEEVECEDSQRCVDGMCVGACDGVVCPAGQSCLAGRCIDACETLTCDDCTVCSDGECLPRCSIEPCASGETCTAEGRCVADDCVDVECADTEHCEGGQCIDNCQDAMCPSGQMCEGGDCVAIPPPMETDAGMPDAGAVEDAGPPMTPDTSPPPADSATAPDASSADAGRPRARGGEPGCACRVSGHNDSRGTLLIAGVVAMLAWRRRR